MSPSRSFGNAWVVLCLALALHVVDEALTGFLSVYNPTVLALRSRLGWFPGFVFDFNVWLGGLIAAVLILLALSRFAYRGVRAMRIAAIVFGVLMAGNAVLHTVLSFMGHTVDTVRFTGPMPGFYSSPFLFAAALHLLAMTRRGGSQVTRPLSSV